MEDRSRSRASSAGGRDGMEGIPVVPIVKRSPVVDPPVVYNELESFGPEPIKPFKPSKVKP